MDPRTYETPAPLIPQLPLHQAHQLPLLPQQMITSGTRKDCIRLRGLPYEAQVEHILEFLGEHAKSIVYQGVHMVYNAQVRLSISIILINHSGKTNQKQNKKKCEIFRVNRVERRSSRWIRNRVHSRLPTSATTTTWCLERSSATSKSSSVRVKTCTSS